jgi:hypothetical protein
MPSIPCLEPDQTVGEREETRASLYQWPRHSLGRHSRGLRAAGRCSIAIASAAGGGPSAGGGATLLPDLGDLGLELVKEVIWGAGHHSIANQVKQRPLQVELLGKVLSLV